MPRLSAFSYALMSVFALGSASLASAADGNSYRAGQIYLKVNAPAPGACALQCEGDAQCKSWNYVPLARSGGVCEFNSNFASAQPHPYAISGVNEAGGYRSSQIISGTTRTTRIGQPVTVRANTQAPLKPRTRPSAMQTQPQSVKPPVITRQRSFAPRNAAPQTAPQAAQAAARHIPAQARMPQQGVNPRSLQQPQRRPAPYPAPPSERELAAQRAALQASQRARARTIPATHRAPLPAAHAPASAAAPAQARAPQGYPQAQQAPQNFEVAARANLYGGLYDDVAAKPKAAPQPLYSERPVDSPDAPIATSPFAKPVTPVDILPLAGAPSQ